MGDIIQLLPENVANQIAAGEVVQRPSSVVKELMENAIDAGASNVLLIVKDAGKTLIQVIDDGKGMSKNDLRMAFERHATSKIRSAQDLFALSTMGFRGEALASIAAVAQVHCASRTADSDVAHFLRIDGGKLVESGQEAKPVGTSMEVKNLFFNIPARRQFLKSDQVEINHITDEFERVALAHPELGFRFFHNQHELFYLQAGNLRQRIVGVMGKKMDKHLVPVEENTEHVAIRGFIAKPEAARKKRGEQFFFVNNRFIKHHVLHHAVVKAFEDVLPNGYHPAYFLFIEVDPASIDVNIHPTKTEISFADDKMIYAMLSSAIKHSLGKHNVAPSLDFEIGSTFSLPSMPNDRPLQVPKIHVDKHYNPFSKVVPERRPATSGWEKLMIDDLKPIDSPTPQTTFLNTEKESDFNPFYQQQKNYKARLFAGSYIIYEDGEIIYLIHPKRAHERVIYDELMRSIDKHTVASQQLLFPVDLELSPADAESLKEFLPAMISLGFDAEIQNNQHIVFFGIPTSITESSLPGIVEDILNDIKEIGSMDETQFNRQLILNLSRSAAVKRPEHLQDEAIQNLLTNLFQSNEPMISPRGKSIVFSLTLQELHNFFNS